MSPRGADEDKDDDELRDTGVSNLPLASCRPSCSERLHTPFIRLEDANTKSGNEAYTKCGDNTPNSDTHAPAIDGRKHLAGDDGSQDAPAHHHNEVKDTHKL